MTNKKNSYFKKTLVFLIIILGLSTLGISYASWNFNIHIDTKVTTGIMNIIFNDKNDPNYNAQIMDINGNAIFPMKVDIDIQQEDKLAKVDFKNALPIDELLKGNIIKIQFPLIPSEDSSVNKLMLNKIDFTKDDNKKEEIDMKAEETFLSFNQDLYLIQQNKENLILPLKFDLFKEISEDENQNIRYIAYLKLKQESINQIQNIQSPFIIDYQNLVKLENISYDDQNMVNQSSGVITIYSCEIPIDLDQREIESLEK